MIATDTHEAPGMSNSLRAHAGPESGVLLELLTSAASVLDTEPERARLSLTRAVAIVRAEAQPHHRNRGLSGLAPWQARKALAHIKSMLDQGIRVEELAILVGLSSSHFSRAFKNTLGCSPQAYILNQRVTRAKLLMLTSDAPLCEVALACGFSDQAHLTRVFKHATEETPGAWRRAHSMHSPESCA